MGGKLRKVARNVAFFLSIVSAIGIGAVAGGEYHFRRLAREEGMSKLFAENISKLPGPRKVDPLQIAVHVHAPGLEYMILTPGDGQKLNSWLYNDDEFVVPKPRGVFRIAVVGDSHAYGYRVHREQSFPSLLEKELGVDVLNLSVIGYNSTHALATMRIATEHLEPDLVIYAFYSNDLMPTTFHYQRKVEKLELKYKRGNSFRKEYVDNLFWEHLKLFFETRSALYSEAMFRWDHLRHEKADHLDGCYNYARTTAVMEDMAELAKEKGINFMVVHVPTIPCLFQGCKAQKKKDKWVTLDDTRPFMEYFKEQHPDIAVLLPYREFLADTSGQPLTVWDQIHLSPRGHEILAVAIYIFLQAHPYLLNKQ